MFVAINYITCKDDYTERFETLFSTRAKVIDHMPGFRFMHVLKPSTSEGDYLIMSFWDSEEDFNCWSKSSEFLEGHQRGFKDMADAKKAGRELPMKSVFKTYNIIAG